MRRQWLTAAAAAAVAKSQELSVSRRSSLWTRKRQNSANAESRFEHTERKPCVTHQVAQQLCSTSTLCAAWLNFNCLLDCLKFASRVFVCVAVARIKFGTALNTNTEQRRARVCPKATPNGKVTHFVFTCIVMRSSSLLHSSPPSQSHRISASSWRIHM